MLYRLLFRLVLRWLPPSLSHTFGSGLLALASRPRVVRRLWRARAFPRRSATIGVEALGLRFPSPLGAAAGIDKNADWFDALGAVGFGFVEIGTVTPQPQQPNPGPTITRVLADHALLNRMGFPNGGADRAASRLRNRSGETIVGVNIGKQRSTALADAAVDYRELTRRLAADADYLVINVSSPNTPGLRDLGSVEQLEPLISAVRSELATVAPSCPLLVKVSPDMRDADIDAVADLALALELDGIVATNTTVDRATIRLTPISTLRWFEGGGVSGPPLKERSLAVLRRLHARTGGRLALISVGGVESVDDVWERLAHGATLVQAYTGFVYGGPLWAARINRGLARRVRQAGLGSIEELIGSVGSPPDPDVQRSRVALPAPFAGR